MEEHVNIIVVGDSAVGKTSLVYTFGHNGFPKDYEPTIADKHMGIIELENESVNFSVWDTAGNPEFTN